MSAYTLPEPLSIAVTLALLRSCFCFLQPLPDEIHLRLRRGNALLRLLLKAMQDVDPAGDSDGIDSPKSAALTARHHLQNTRGAEALQGLRLHVLPTRLGSSDEPTYALQSLMRTPKADYNM